MHKNCNRVFTSDFMTSTFLNTDEGRKKYKLCVKNHLEEYQTKYNITSTDSLLKFSVWLQEKMEKLKAMRGKGKDTKYFSIVVM